MELGRSPASKATVSCNASLARASQDEIVHSPENIAVVADHERVASHRDRQLGERSHQLRDLGAGYSEGVGHAVHDNELVVRIRRDAAAQEPAVFGLVIEDMLKSSRDIATMRISSIEQAPIRKDPEDEVRVAMGKILYRVTTA